MMNMEDISASIRPIAERYGVDRIYMSTGSRAEDRIELSMDSGKLVSMRDIFEFTDELEDLFGTKVNKVYQIIFCLVLIVGATSQLEIVWNIADTLNGLMALPNLIALLLLSPVVVKYTREYFSDIKAAKKK